MHKVLHPRDNMDRRKEGKGLSSIEDRVDTSIRLLEVFIKKNEERLI